MYMFRYRRAKNCKACVINNTNSCATNITIAQPRNAPPKPNREKAIKVLDENGNEVPTFVPNQNTVQDSYFFSDGFGNPNSSNRKLATLSQPAKTELSQIINGNIFKQGSAWANGYITKSQSNLESNVGSMGRIERLKANAISGDRKICNPILLGQTNYMHLAKTNLVSGYFRPSVCSNPILSNVCAGNSLGSINSCQTDITLLNFTLLGFINVLTNNTFVIIWRRKIGLNVNSVPSFTSLTISGKRDSNNQNESVTLNLSQTVTPAGGFSFGNALPNENTIMASWDSSVLPDVAIVKDILNGNSSKKVIFQFH